MWLKTKLNLPFQLYWSGGIHFFRREICSEKRNLGVTIQEIGHFSQNLALKIRKMQDVQFIYTMMVSLSLETIYTLNGRPQDQI